eukprot:1840010-Rhodomonas_salina.4
MLVTGNAFARCEKDDFLAEQTGSFPPPVRRICSAMSSTDINSTDASPRHCGLERGRFTPLATEIQTRSSRWEVSPALFAMSNPDNALAAISIYVRAVTPCPDVCCAASRLRASEVQNERSAEQKRP